MRWPHHSCREMHQSLVHWKRGNQGGHEVPLPVPLHPSPSHPPPIERPGIPDIVHPGMPCPLMGLRKYAEVTPGHGSTGSLGHLPTAHIPLWLQQRFQHILGAAVVAGGMEGPGHEQTKELPPLPIFPGPCPHLQSGTTMGLSLMARNSPCSFSASSTAFLASNLGRP
jgi:hypothetical protein